MNNRILFNSRIIMKFHVNHRNFYETPQDRISCHQQKKKKRCNIGVLFIHRCEWEPILQYRVKPTYYVTRLFCQTTLSHCPKIMAKPPTRAWESRQAWSNRLLGYTVWMPCPPPLVLVTLVIVHKYSIINHKDPRKDQSGPTLIGW